MKVNQEVKAGEPIGLGGNTGLSFGSHLHFETRLLGEAIDPALLFDFPNQDVTGDFYVFHKNGGSEERNASNGTKRYATHFYQVKKGDNLSTIARKLGISLKKLCLNNLNRNSKIRPKQILKY